VSPGAEAPRVEPAPAGSADADIVSRAEFNKVVGQRQAAKEKVRQLSAQVDELLARLGEGAGQPGASAEQDRRPARAADANANQEIETLPEPARARIQDLLGRKETLEKRLADLLADQELRIAAAAAHAINPDQVVALLRGRVRMIETSDGRFEPHVADPAGRVALDGDKPVRDVRRFVEAFLALPENANLVRCTVIPGSGARQAGAAVTHLDNLPQSKAEFLALPPSQRLTVANRMTRQQRDSILGRAPAGDGGYI